MGSMLPYVAYMDPMGNKTHGHLLPPPKTKPLGHSQQPFIERRQFCPTESSDLHDVFLPRSYIEFMISASQQESQVMTTTQNVWRLQKIPKCQGMVNHWGIHQKNFTMEVSISPNLWRLQKIPSGERTKSNGKSPCLMGKSTIDGHFQLLC